MNLELNLEILNRSVLTIVTAVVIFGLSLQVFNIIGFNLFPASEKPQFLINITTPPQSNILYTDYITRNIEEELIKQPAINYFTSNVGKGNPRIYYNEVPENEKSEYAQIFVQLDNHTAPDKKMAIIESLRKKWTPYPGAKIEVKNFQQGPPVVAPIEVRVFGDNLDTLRSLAAKVENMLQNTDGAIYIDNPVDQLKSDIKVDINKEKAQLLGIQTVNIDKTVRLAVAGLNMGKYTDQDDKDYSILLTRTKEEIPEE